MQSKKNYEHYFKCSADVVIKMKKNLVYVVIQAMLSYMMRSLLI